VAARSRRRRYPGNGSDKGQPPALYDVEQQPRVETALAGVLQVDRGRM
jgi:hypothetical protein